MRFWLPVSHRIVSILRKTCLYMSSTTYVHDLCDVQEHPRDRIQRRSVRRQLSVPSRGELPLAEQVEPLLTRGLTAYAAGLDLVLPSPQKRDSRTHNPQADIDACVEYIKDCAVRARSSWRNALRISEYVQGATCSKL